MPTDYIPQHDEDTVHNKSTAELESLNDALDRIADRFGLAYWHDLAEREFNESYTGKHATSQTVFERYRAVRAEPDGGFFIVRLTDTYVPSGVLPRHPSDSEVRGEHGVPVGLDVVTDVEVMPGVANDCAGFGIDRELLR